ncbi:MAG: SpoIIE family protein phosphatase [Bacteroidota bacterium]|nr:SpoIIE family protein phosphatase [Bacteroidota bacterium]
MFAFTVITCLLLGGHTAAQQRIPGEYRFGAVGIADGLSQGMVYCIMQDARGFLWFGTKEGLNRYDGYSFTVYRNIPGDSSSLADNQVFSLAEDVRGRIWIGTRTKGLQLFDPVTETFTPFPIPSNNPHRTIDEAIHHLVVDREGYLWIGGWKRLLARLDTRHEDAGPLRRSCTPFHTDRRFITTHHFLMSRTGTGHVTMLANDGVWSFRAPTHGFEKMLDWRAMGFPKDKKRFEVISGAADREGEYWLSAKLDDHFVLLRIDMASKRIRDTLRFEHNGAELIARAMIRGPDGMLYCSGSYYFIRCDPVRRTYSVTVPLSGQSGRLSGDVSTLRFDRSGNLWIGTTGLGLHTFNPNTLAFHADSRPLKEALFARELRIFEQHVRSESGDPGRILNSAFPVRGTDGSVWCGTINYGLLHYDPASGKVRRFGFTPADPYSFLMLRLGVPFVDSRGDVWIGNTQGISRLVDRPEQWEHFFYDADGPDLTQPEDNVNCMHEDPDGSLWLGTVSRGLVHFRPSTGEFRIFSYEISDSTSISSNHVLSIAADPDHPGRYLWIGTDGGGLNRYDRHSGTFRRFGLKHGLPNMVIYGILPDDGGSLWMSSNGGITRLEPRGLRFTNFQLRDGLQDNEFNRTELYRIPPRLYFGGVKGHNSFIPGEIRRNTAIPPIVITGLRIFNKPVTDRAILPESVSYARSITLAHDQNMLTFEFAALDYSSPDRNRYRYRMHGLDDEWIDAGTARSATYTYLAPGAYTFRVIGSNNHGVWNTTGAHLRIIVLPPWWRTSWAYAGYGIVLVLILVGIDRLQRRRVINRERQHSSMREAVLRAEAAEFEARAVRAEQERSEQDMRIAADIQRRIIPQSLPEIPGYDIAGINLPAHEIGGDYYDCIPLGDDRYALVIADVTGKGIPAALLVNSLHASLRVQLDTQRSLVDLALRLNDFIYRVSSPSTFITFIIAILHAPSGALELLNAGHNPAMIRASDGSISVLTEHGLPLGCSVEITLYNSEHRVLRPGEGLLLHTDGIPEAMNARMEQFGEDALEAFLSAHPAHHPADVLDALAARLFRHRGASPQSDDITMLFLHRKSRSIG